MLWNGSSRNNRIIKNGKLRKTKKDERFKQI